MGHHTEAFVGIDTSKSRNVIAIAYGGRGAGVSGYGGGDPEARGQACGAVI